MGLFSYPLMPALLSACFSAILGEGLAADDFSKISEPVSTTSKLYQAALKGDIQEVRKYSSHVSELFRRSPTGEMFLHIAAAEGEKLAVKALLIVGAPIEARNLNGETPLFIAVKNNHTDTARVLIEFGADVNRRNQEGKGPLHLAAEIENSALVELLLFGGADTDSTDYAGKTALCAATEKANPLIFQALSKVGFDSNFKTLNGESLHLAEKDNNTNAIETLITASARIGMKNKQN